MDILNSDWLIKMLEKSSNKPHERLLKLFDILEDWLDAPNVVASSLHVQFNAMRASQTATPLLQDFLTLEAAKAGAAMPEILANQLYFMAVAAAHEKLEANNSKSLMHAKSAACAIIAAQTKKEFHIKKSTGYAIAASFLAIVVGTSALFMFSTEKKPTLVAISQATAQSVAPIKTSIPSAEPAVNPEAANPELTAALVAQLELMRHGNCQLIEAIQLPDSQKGIYINMVVNGHVSTDPREQLIALDLIKRTRCNYTPMLMANSTG
jgi:hypothetical protein